MATIEQRNQTLTFLLALTFLFLFSGSATAGLFSPDDYDECILENMPDATNRESATSIRHACSSKFTEEYSEEVLDEECVLKNMTSATSKNIHEGCLSELSGKSSEGFWNLFGPKDYGDCVLKYTKGVEDSHALTLIQLACGKKY